MDHLNKGGNYDIPLNYAKELFAKKDPNKMALFSNSEYDEENSMLKIRCMDMNLFVKYPSENIFYENNEKLRKTALEILIIRFLTNSNPVGETHKYITFKEVDGGHVYYQAFLKTTIKQLVE